MLTPSEFLFLCAGVINLIVGAFVVWRITR